MSFQNSLSKFFLWPRSTSIFDILKKRYLRGHFFKENLIICTKKLIRFDRSFFLVFLIILTRRHAYCLLLNFWSFLWKMDLIWSVFSFKQSLIIKRQHGLVYIPIERTFDLFLRSIHMVWFILSFSNIANNFWWKSRRVSPI